MDGINLWNFFPIFVFIGLFVMILILYFSNDDIKSTYNTKKINELEKTTEQDFEYNKK